MRVSEKSLELNIGAELLYNLRARKGFEKLYFRGLTQAQERRDGADFFAHLDPQSRVFAFQFKAPKDAEENAPYRYRLVRYQHEPLFDLAKTNPKTVFYVFPYFSRFAKLHRESPTLLAETRFLDVSKMDVKTVFSSFASRTVSCTGNVASVNPEFALESFSDLQIPDDAGVKPSAFADWYGRLQLRLPVQSVGAANGIPAFSLTRGLYFAISSPSVPKTLPDDERAR